MNEILEHAVLSNFSGGTDDLTAPITTHFTKNNRSIVMSLPAGGVTAVTDLLEATGFVPEQFRPMNDLYFPIVVNEDATAQIGVLKIGADGTIAFYQDVALTVPLDGGEAFLWSATTFAWIAAS